MHVSASILACNVLNIASELGRIGNADSIHFDVMDGHLVERISFGDDLCRKVASATTLPICTHLMVSNSEEQIERFIEAGSCAIAVHPDGCSSVKNALDLTQKHGKKFGLAVYSENDFSEALKYKNLVNFLIFMTVKPGNSFQKISMDRLNLMAEFSQKIGPEKVLFADGGVNGETVKLCVQNGANAVVSGGYIFKNSEPKKAIEELKDFDKNGLGEAFSS